jgi:hypothetical protein
MWNVRAWASDDGRRGDEDGRLQPDGDGRDDGEPPASRAPPQHCDRNEADADDDLGVPDVRPERRRKEKPMPQRRDVSKVANQVEGHPALQIGARVGYAVSGVLHLLIGWIALQVAWSASGKPADQSGALQALAGNSLGRLTLWVAVLEFLALALWQLASVLAVRTGGESSQLAERAKGISKAVVYLVLAWTSFSTAKGKPSSGKAQSADFTATLLQHTGGRLLVAVIGLAVIGVGSYHVVKGWTKKFLQDLSGNPGILATRAGVVGYIAKGIALAPDCRRPRHRRLRSLEFCSRKASGLQTWRHNS